jgi:hypothetical protein
MTVDRTTKNDQRKIQPMKTTNLILLLLISTLSAHAQFPDAPSTKNTVVIVNYLLSLGSSLFFSITIFGLVAIILKHSALPFIFSATGKHQRTDGKYQRKCGMH